MSHNKTHESLPRLRLHGAELDTCENCGSAPLTAFCVPRQTVLWRCPACGLYQKGMPTGEPCYEDHYHDKYQSARKRKLRTATARLNHLAPLLISRAPRVLDIGCSVGATVEAATLRGWQAFGVDVSQDAVAWCLEQGLNCRHFDGVALPFPSTFFDLVTGWHVLEHVRDARGTLSEWSRVLRPGGILAVETPNANCWKARWLGPRYRKFWPAEHYYAFTPGSLNSLIESSGMHAVSAPWMGGFRRMSMSQNDLLYGALRRVCLGVSRATGFSKSVQVIARKPADLTSIPRLARAA